jgi:hypothetical protein
MRLAFLLPCFFLINALVGCTNRTDLGECIGLDDKEDPRFEYDIAVWNVAMGTVFFELFFIPPIYVALENIKCPEAIKSPSERPSE